MGTIRGRLLDFVKLASSIVHFIGKIWNLFHLPTGTERTQIITGTIVRDYGEGVLPSPRKKIEHQIFDTPNCLTPEFLDLKFVG